MQSADESLGILISRSARALDRALDEALVAAGGSTVAWLVLHAVAAADRATQVELARSIGIRQPTLTHHLDSLERAGFVTRQRDPADRRAQRVTMTDEGGRLFLRLRRVASSYDGRLRAGLDPSEAAELRRLLDLVVENSAPD